MWPERLIFHSEFAVCVEIVNELTPLIVSVFLVYASQMVVTDFLTPPLPNSRMAWGKSSPASSPICRHVSIWDPISFYSVPFCGEVIGLTLGEKAILKEMSFWICFKCRNLSQIALLIKEICRSWSNIQPAWVKSSLIPSVFGQPGKAYEPHRIHG